jgi:hypothetical protein
MEATKKENAKDCLRFLNYLEFLRPAADRTDTALPLIASRGRSSIPLFFFPGQRFPAWKPRNPLL